MSWRSGSKGNLESGALIAPDNILQGSLIYDEQRFVGVDLREETADLLWMNPQAQDLARLNRLLLEDAYPLEVVRDPTSSDLVIRGGAIWGSRSDLFDGARRCRSAYRDGRDPGSRISDLGFRVVLARGQ